MLTTVILQLLLAGVTHAPLSLELQAPKDVDGRKCFVEQSCLVAYDPIHGPDPNREIHDNGLPINNPDPYGGRMGNGSDPYGGRFGGTDPYGGKTDNGRDPYAGRL